MISAKGGGKPFAQIYPDPRSAEWEDTIVRQVRSQLDRLAQADDGQELVLPFRERVIAVLRYNLVRPKSLPKSVTLPVHSKEDVDNLEKAIFDALQKSDAGVLANDSQVTDVSHFKRYADEAHPVGVEVDLTGWIPNV